MLNPATSLVIPQPAAGADFALSLPVPGRLHLIHATLTTSATAGNRIVHAVYKDPTNICCNLAAINAVGASGTLSVTFSMDLDGYTTDSGDDNTIFIPLPSIVVPTTWVISSVTTGLAIGDQWSSIVAVYETAV